MTERLREPDGVERFAEEPVDAQRYVEALRRRAGRIFAVSVGVAVLVLLISLTLSKTYRATAQIAPPAQAATTSSAASSPAAQQNLATIQAYITSPAVLQVAASSVGRESVASLQAKLGTSLDANSNILSVTANDGDARHAAQLATGVAQAFLSVRASQERTQLAQQEAILTQKMRAATGAASAGLVAALQQQISSIAAQEAGAGTDLQLLAPALVPAAPSSPSPARNAVFAFVAALFLAVLGVCGRQLLAPTISNEQELSTVIDLPILGRVPQAANGPSAGDGPGSNETEAYRFVAKSLDLASWERTPRLVGVTSAAAREGRTTVVSRLGAALAEAGSRTLLISPDLNGELGRRAEAGLGTVLASSTRDGVPPRDAVKRVGKDLFQLTAKGRSPAAAAALTSDSVKAMLEKLHKLDYEYILIDLPPLLAVAETQLFVRQVETLLLVSWVGRTTSQQLTQTRELLERLDVRAAGIVVLGVRGERNSGTRRPHFRRGARRPKAGEAPELGVLARGNVARRALRRPR